MALNGHKSHVAYMNYIHGDKEQARARPKNGLLANRLATTGLNCLCEKRVIFFTFTMP
jgi:hypothetical protein